MRESIVSNPPLSSAHRPEILVTAVVLVTVGLSLLVLMAEWFATYDACVANPTCTPGVSGATIDTYLGLMVLGVALAVGGVALASRAVRGIPRRALILWL